MKTRYVISLESVMEVLDPHSKELERLGLDARGIFWYVLHLVNYRDRGDVLHHLEKDLMETAPDLFLADRREWLRMQRTCMAYLDIAAAVFIPYIERICGKCDHTLRFEQMQGDVAIISI